MGNLRNVLLFLTVSFSSALLHPLQSQIIGGHEAKPHSRPYIAALKVGDGYGCGGFLVAPQWVMTAAHCMDDITVVLGAHDLTALEESQQVIGVRSYHVHPEYNPMSIANDILLMKLEFEPVLNKNVQIVPLPKSGGDLPAGTSCSIAGWGLIDEDKVTPRLFETNVDIYNRRKCRMVYPWLDDGMICAGSHKQLLDTSQGDSGGPMVCNGVVHGIVSFGYSSPPGVYSRIAHFLPWIQKVMESDP
ncbi:mast cell protease 1A-like [Anolis sagrei]|uniref:mast cell protease 1A-like n=1 Tax=Anolis sagrei TaxID=38937 RepID=UPI00352146E9